MCDAAAKAEWAVASESEYVHYGYNYRNIDPLINNRQKSLIDHLEDQNNITSCTVPQGIQKVIICAEQHNYAPLSHLDQKSSRFSSTKFD